MEEMLLHVMCATQGLFLNSKGEPILWQWLGCGCAHEGTLRGKPGSLAGETLGAGKTSSVELPNNLAVLLFLVYEKESDLLYWDHCNIGVSWLGQVYIERMWYSGTHFTDGRSRNHADERTCASSCSTKQESKPVAIGFRRLSNKFPWLVYSAQV